MRKIHTTNGKPAIVDDEDYLSLKSRNWYVKQNGNTKLICGTTLKKGKSRMVLLHREILGLSDVKKVVVHKNGNPFDNRKRNLMVIDRGKQTYSRKKNSNGKSYKGTTYNKKNNTYVATISKDGVKYNLGSFATAEESAMVYDKAALELFGGLAKTNKALGLIKYNKLPNIEIIFAHSRKPRYRIDRIDRVRTEFLRKTLKKLYETYNYSQLEKLFDYDQNELSKFVRKNTNFRPSNLEYLYSKLKGLEIRKILKVAGIFQVP
ncbi:AP2 domain-containing protein [Leptospira neocaledonica]|uniref:AP2/ERF domain-containing protein n=1 Tax=Leptospira neocaledonica TaxID=2023192 RepID=A0A2M9ZZD2_9LEPT|nr:AP2 domain-containing protein [Leptospira neocaledonica]PJZ77407.1 hypothetical protein CH365_07405 [Leptospira neocaledonica]